MKKFYDVELSYEKRHRINVTYDFIINIIRIVNPDMDFTSTKYDNIYDLVCYYIDDIIIDKE